MSESLATVDTVIKTIAETCIENEKYFCELDSIVGDGDFGFSLARGFEKVLEDYENFDRKDIGTLLKKVGMVIVSRCGGTSGPLWGTGFMRAGMILGDKTSLRPEDVVSMVRAAVEGIQARGKAELGDKTLLDALSPFADSFEKHLGSTDSLSALALAAADTQQAAEATSVLIAKRGRAAYTGERSIGSPDAGAMAIALLINKISEVLNSKT